MLVACASSMGIVSKVLSSSSPLLGLFSLFRVDFASVEDTVVSLSEQGLKPRSAILWAIVARDPWILAHLDPAGEPWRVLAREAERLAPLARGLVGEVFSEEERSLTKTYDAVLHMLAEGLWRAQEIAARLYSLRYTILAGGNDIDVVLLDKSGRGLWGYEVKIGPIHGGVARSAVDAMRQAGLLWAGLVSLARRPPPVGDEALGPEDIVDLARRLASARRRAITQ